MKKFVILPDAFCELNKDLRQEYDIDFVPSHIVKPDGEEVKLNLEWDFISHEDFYSSIKKDPSSYKTSPASVGEYAEKFEAYVKQGIGVLSMSISTGLSGSYNFTLQARELVMKKYPDAEIECIDSLRYGPGYGLLAIYASQLREEGKSLKETAAWINENKNRFHQSGWLDDLTFVARKGRITNAKAFFGQLVGIKPVGEFDYNGLTTVIGNIKGEKAAYRILLEYIAAEVENPENQIMVIAQTDRLKQAEIFKTMIEERFHPKKIYICDVFPGCGVNVGPGLMSLYYMGKPISQGLVEERKLFESLTQKK